MQYTIDQKTINEVPLSTRNPTAIIGITPWRCGRAEHANTYSVEYGRGSGVETRMSTKCGTDQFRGFASDCYPYQGFNARGEFGPSHT